MPRAARFALAAAAALAALLVAAQLLLPVVAERRLRERLERNGKVDFVDVSAFPAFKLLGGGADRVTLRMSDARAGAGRFADLVAGTADTDRLDAEVAGLRIITLRLRALTLRKRGPELEAAAAVTDAAVRAALPDGFDVRPVAARGGDGGLVFEGTARLLGRRLTGRAELAVREGRVVIVPDLPLGRLLALTVFDDPRIEVRSLGAQARPDGFVLTARARLRR